VPRFVAFLTLLALPLVVGCEGCRRDRPAEREAEQEAPLDEFTARPPVAFPGDLQPIAGGIKPGHWFTAAQPLRSNRADRRGRLHSHCFLGGVNPQNRELARVATNVTSARPLVLPKGQMRQVDYRLLSPLPRSTDSQRCYLASRVTTTAGALLFDTVQQPFNALTASEYFFVILTNRPERFAPLQVADWVRPPSDDTVFQRPPANFRIVIPPVDDVLPLAETMLDWTSTAVLFWDDLGADALTPDQQRAIGDWVHFGGQLVVNGAAASEAVAGSGLAGLLPLQPTGNIELDPAGATELLRGYAVASDQSTEKQRALVADQSARLAVDGIASDDASAISNTGSLVLERRIGRGRVVQSRFDLTSDWLVQWNSFDSFFNSAILRRPKRRYRGPGPSNELASITQTYPDFGSIEADPALNTRLRIASRDAVLSVDDGPVTAASSSPVSQLDRFAQVDSRSGIAGWSDTSDAISLCRQILRDESGIDIPQVSLVVRSLSLYLLILVPVNYLVFRLFGRLEFAWLAVPLIAIGGALLIARAARLDIGFARSHTELGLLEIQPGHPRGHLSRVIALYNSLSSTYDIQFETIDSAAAPVGDRFETEQPTEFRLGFGDGPTLSDLVVGSNQVRLLHCEAIVDIGGTIELGEENELINKTDYDLQDLIVIEKSARGDVSVRSADSCESGAAVKLSRRPAEFTSRAGLPLQSQRLLNRLASPAALPAGSGRLVARVDGAPEGMAIVPAASQHSAQTAVLAHLHHPPLPEPQIDDNLISDFRNFLSDLSTESDAQAIDTEAVP